MPTSSPAPRTTSVADEAEAPPTNHELVRAHADRLVRVAAECCRQHERLAHLTERAVDDGELKGAEELLALCVKQLDEATAAYEKVSRREHPNGPDSGWWHCANALWMASREYQRRHAGCDRAARRVAAERDPKKLAELQMDYELEASALLSLKQAVDAYRKECPEATERPSWRTS